MATSVGMAAYAAAATAPFADGVTLIVAGPGGGPVDSWAEWLAPSLGKALPPGTQLRKDLVGGIDGVTGANQFEARTVPDGGTALLLPGSAAMAWLVGDPRARFDVGHWVPALAGITPGLVVSRLSLAQVMAGASVRIAASGPSGQELPALLALDLLGVKWTPVFGLTDAAASAALADGEADAVCLHGRRVAEMAQLLASTGVRPLFSFGSVDDTGRRVRDPAFPDTPALSELMAVRPATPGMRNAWRATAAASELDMALVLPQLTPASMVALWRRACAQAIGSSPVQEQASALGVRPQGVPAATASTTAVLADATAQLELRNWLATRLNYRPA
ncbi:hypothetical protein [Acidisphaera sp. L21]|uniref:hypothetical protein n=1 Tax=Acidisphaera sp. L21 TaxID=1641851 RepID=UPI001C207C4B|nr:hypothetical protein [Acidisphaera sp. L21]